MRKSVTLRQQAATVNCGNIAFRKAPKYPLYTSVNEGRTMPCF